MSGVRLGALACALVGGLLACTAEVEEPTYRSEPVVRRSLLVAAEAAGVVEPEITVEVKSKASGEILEIAVETGDRVERGALLVRIDQRQPSNALALADAELESAQARATIARDQLDRARRLYESKSIPETQYEQARLEAANAQAALVRARVARENAQIQMDDTLVTAPITGTVIEKSVERGQVISSPIQDVSGGTSLLRMADLSVVQVRTLIDETDIGKIREAIPARVEVSAYPSRRFEGRVLKIEPQAIVDQSVTMFPVRVRLDNPEGLLRPGMNANVEIRVDERADALCVPNAALVAPRDARMMAQLIGAEVPELPRSRSGGGPSSVDGPPSTGRPVGAAGGSEDPRAGALAVREYVVFVERDGGHRGVLLRTGLTDLDHTEVLAGELREDDRVLLLPSADLVRSEQRFRERIEGITGGGLPGVRGRGR